MEYTIKGTKCFKTKYGNEVVIIIDFNGEMVDLFAPKLFDSKAADLEKKFKKLGKCMPLKVTDKNKKII